MLKDTFTFLKCILTIKRYSPNALKWQNPNLHFVKNMRFQMSKWIKPRGKKRAFLLAISIFSFGYYPPTVQANSLVLKEKYVLHLSNSWLLKLYISFSSYCLALSSQTTNSLYTCKSEKIGCKYVIRKYRISWNSFIKQLSMVVFSNRKQLKHFFGGINTRSVLVLSFC